MSYFLFSLLLLIQVNYAIYSTTNTYIYSNSFSPPPPSPSTSSSPPSPPPPPPLPPPPSSSPPLPSPPPPSPSPLLLQPPPPPPFPPLLLYPPPLPVPILIWGCDSRRFAQHGSTSKCPPPPLPPPSPPPSPPSPPPPPIINYLISSPEDEVPSESIFNNMKFAPQDEVSTSDGLLAPTDEFVDDSFYDDFYQYLSIESSYDEQQFVAEIQPLQITPSKDEVILCGTFWKSQPPQGFDGSQFTHCYPLSAVGRLQIYYKGSNDIATCTGALIGAHTVLTAAHCFLQETTNIEFTPGQFGQYKPFGSFQNGTVFKPNKKFDRKTGENDYAVVKFSEDIGALTGWLGVEYLSCKNFEGKKQYDLMVAGYANDKSDKMWTAECEDTFVDSCDESGQFAHVCDTLGGTSGAPLIENNMIVGIHSGASRVLENNIATYVTWEIMEFISTYIS